MARINCVYFPAKESVFRLIPYILETGLIVKHMVRKKVNQHFKIAEVMIRK